MNISEVKVKLTGNDILSIINEFVKIEGVNLKSVTIEDGIILEGTFIKGIKIEFLVKAEMVECLNNKIVARIVKVKILNLRLFRILRSFALKQLAKAFADYGIKNDKDKAIVDINMILKDVPFVDLTINEIFMKRSELWVEASNINISIAGELIKKVEVEEVKEEDVDTSAVIEITNKVEDKYSKGREILSNKLPEEARQYKDYLFILTDIISLIYRLLKDKRVPLKTKLIMSSAIAYITIPTDLIPSKIPFIGVIDDIGVGFFALNKVLNDVPLSVIIENWEGKNELLIVLKNGIEYLTDFTGARNVAKLYDVVEELSTL